MIKIIDKGSPSKGLTFADLNKGDLFKFCAFDKSPTSDPLMKIENNRFINFSGGVSGMLSSDSSYPFTNTNRSVIKYEGELTITELK